MEIIFHYTTQSTNCSFHKQQSSGIITGTGFRIKEITVENLESAGMLNEEKVSILINDLNGDLSQYRMELSGTTNEVTFNEIFKSDKLNVKKAGINYSVNLQKSKSDFLWDGELTVKNGEIDLSSQNLILEELNGEFIFNNDELALQDVALKIEASDLLLTGHILNPTQILRTMFRVIPYLEV